MQKDGRAIKYEQLQNIKDMPSKKPSLILPEKQAEKNKTQAVKQLIKKNILVTKNIQFYQFSAISFKKKVQPIKLENVFQSEANSLYV
ncbi:hypothetical protein TTHERM_01270170 (macronuclear) [Tetrahymena thermophila SB210]|uniref:Uncharacterized protein n=1 Tax=Tetrahymena thermophila (strain SB210) TaxID=312017 RepID=Q22QR0_TETTS|nr:hypothetical protein TTHERM_01270170 [Tetrahymena thermophila SB210]EAR87612.1 hypothetical protein TTHERM_01270170 [Tetrahymena thermophila SB210]|eukprot:XP_001007857.1 hypothetical protein TTHERM_01270170 [Tetrahymena thermophila SB210]